MKEELPAWKMYVLYLGLLALVLWSSLAYGQIEAKHFNAGWNDANSVAWFMDLKDCKTLGLTDIAKNPEEATKHKIAVVPTIIIFKDGEEVARFQADLSFKMVATREEIQEEIDNIIMSDF